MLVLNSLARPKSQLQAANTYSKSPAYSHKRYDVAYEQCTQWAVELLRRRGVHVVMSLTRTLTPYMKWVLSGKDHFEIRNSYHDWLVLREDSYIVSRNRNGSMEQYAFPTSCFCNSWHCPRGEFFVMFATWWIGTRISVEFAGSEEKETS